MADEAVLTNISEMIDLALGTPEVGVVDFNMLQTVLHCLAQQLGVLGKNVEIRGGVSTLPVGRPAENTQTVAVSEFIVEPEAPGGFELATRPASPNQESVLVVERKRRADYSPPRQDGLPVPGGPVTVGGQTTPAGGGRDKSGGYSTTTATGGGGGPTTGPAPPTPGLRSGGKSGPPSAQAITGPSAPSGMKSAASQGPRSVGTGPSAEKPSLVTTSKFNLLEGAVADLKNLVYGTTPKNEDLLQEVRSQGNMKAITDMWNNINLSSRLEAAEEGIGKLGSLIEDLIGETVELQKATGLKPSPGTTRLAERAKAVAQATQSPRGPPSGGPGYGPAGGPGYGPAGTPGQPAPAYGPPGGQVDPAYGPPGGQPAPGYGPPGGQPAPGYGPPGGQPAPGYGPPGGQPAPGYGPPGGQPAPGYGPPGGQPAPAYGPPGSQPALGPPGGQPAPGYGPPGGQPAPGYGPPGGQPAPGYGPPGGQPAPGYGPPGGQPAPGYGPPGGQPAPGYGPPGGQQAQAYGPPGGQPAPGYGPPGGQPAPGYGPPGGQPAPGPGAPGGQPAPGTGPPGGQPAPGPGAPGGQPAPGTGPPGGQPAPGYGPPGGQPAPGYGPPGGQPAPGYGPPGGQPAPGYGPPGGQPAPAYGPPGGQPAPGYGPPGGQPAPGYGPPGGQPAPGYGPPGGQPAPGYGPPGGQPAPGYGPPGGQQAQAYGPPGAPQMQGYGPPDGQQVQGYGPPGGQQAQGYGPQSGQQSGGGAPQGPGYVVQGPGGVVQGPGGVVQGPGGVVSGPGGVVQGPGGVVQGPGGVVQGPGGIVSGPGGVVQGPGGVVSGPGGVVQGPGGVVSGPGGVVGGPGGAPFAPMGYTPGAAGATFDMSWVATKDELLHLLGHLQRLRNDFDTLTETFYDAMKKVNANFVPPAALPPPSTIPLTIGGAAGGGVTQGPGGGGVTQGPGGGGGAGARSVSPHGGPVTGTQYQPLHMPQGTPYAMQMPGNVHERLLELERQLQKCYETINKSDGLVQDQLNSFQDQLEYMSKQIALTSDLGSGKISPDLVKDLQGLMQLFQTVQNMQTQLQQVHETALHLAAEKETRQNHIDALLEQIELLKTIKLDREDMVEALADKADLRMVARKVSQDQFEMACDDLSKGLEHALGKLNVQEALWQQALDDIQREIETKLDKMELSPVKDFFNNKLKQLQENLKHMAALRREAEAAGTKRRLLRDVNCISCDAKAVMAMDAPPPLPSKPLPANLSMKPYLSYELDAIRKAQASSLPHRNMHDWEHMQQQMQPKQPYKVRSESDKHLCNRYCGGSHTVTTPAQRVARLGHFIKQWGPEVLPLSSGFAAGDDGRLYKITTEENANVGPGMSLFGSDRASIKELNEYSQCVRFLYKQELNEYCQCVRSSL